MGGLVWAFAHSFEKKKQPNLQSFLGLFVFFFLVKGFACYSPKRRTRSDMTHGSESHARHTWRHRTFAFACFSRVFTKENQRDKRKKKKKWREGEKKQNKEN